jgi:ABC-type branched-subunit amino acid transport system substrate-binding protein
MKKLTRGIAVLAATALLIGGSATSYSADLPLAKSGDKCKTVGDLAKNAQGGVLECAKITSMSNIYKLKTASGPRLKIGIVLPQSGVQSPEGNEARRGFEMAVADFGGSAGGRKIELVFGDATTTPVATSETLRLITQKKVDMFVGTYSSGISLGQRDAAARYDKTVVECLALTDALTLAGATNYFRVGPRAVDFAKASANFLASDLTNKVGKRVFLEAESGLYGTSVSDTQAKLLTEAGLTVGRGKHAYSASDVTDSVLAAKAFNPDIWMITSYIAADTLFLKTADALNFHPKAIVLVGTGDAKSLFDAVGAKVATGVMVIAYTTPLVNPTFAPSIGKFWAAFEAKFKVKPLGTVASTAYSGMTAALRMIDAAEGKVDPVSFGAAAKTITIPIGGQPNGFGVKMDENRQNTEIRLLAVQWRADGTVPAVWPDAAQLPGQAVKLVG